MEVASSIVETIGNTPIVRLRGNLFAKLEGANPGGMKDRPARHMIESAEKSGRLRKGMRVVESSSGTLALGLARVGIVKGYPVTIVTDTRMDSLTKASLVALGVELIIVDRKDSRGGWQTARKRRLRQVIRHYSAANVFWPQQYDNPANRAAYYHSLAVEMLDQMERRIDVLVAAVGSGGSITGTATVLREHIPHVRVVAVDSVGSVIFGQPERPRLMSGMGMSIMPLNLDYSLIDEVHWVADGEAFYSARSLARTTGILAGASSGAVYLVAKWWARKNPSKTVVAIFPDRGDRYWATVYDNDWLKEKNVLGVKPDGEPTTISRPGQEATRWARCTDGRIFRCSPARTKPLRG